MPKLDEIRNKIEERLDNDQSAVYGEAQKHYLTENDAESIGEAIGNQLKESFSPDTSDTWVNLNAKTLFPGVAGVVDKTIGSLNKTAAGLQTMVNGVTGKIDLAFSGVSFGTSILDQLNNTGFNVLYLTPGSGDLSQRLNNAKNKPQGGNYSCGIVIAASAPNLKDIASTYKLLIDSLTNTTVEEMGAYEIKSAWNWKK